MKELLNCKNCNDLYHQKGTKQMFCKNSCWIEYKTKHGIGKNTGCIWSLESRQRASESQKNRYIIYEHYAKGKKLPNRSGENHHYYGKKRSDNTKQKISISRKGKAVGELNPLWKGGITAKEKKERVKFSIQLRKLVLQRDNYTCVICNSVGGNLQVDHIMGWSEYPNLRFDIDNCRTVCMACHYYITFKKKIPKGIVWGHTLSRRIAS